MPGTAVVRWAGAWVRWAGAGSDVVHWGWVVHWAGAWVHWCWTDVVYWAWAWVVSAVGCWSSSLIHKIKYILLINLQDLGL